MTVIRVLLAFTVACGAAGCQDLPSIVGEVCGNGVVDPDEDCDTGGRCDETCKLGCDVDDDCVTGLGAGYRCGVDQRCHAPSGVFEQTASKTFEFVVGQGLVADINSDRIGDIIGFGDINIDVRFGDGAGELDTQARTLLPYSNGNFGMRTLPGGVHDILLPTPDGIVAFTSPGDTLTPYPFANDLGAKRACTTLAVNGVPTGKPVGFFSLDKHRLGMVIRKFDSTLAHVAVLDVLTGDCGSIPACGLTVTDPEMQMGLPQDPVIIDHYETSTEPLSSVIAVAIPTSATTQATCVVRLDHSENAAPSARLAFTALTPSGPVSSDVVGPITLARSADAASCPSLFLATQAGVRVYPPPATTPCAMSSTSPGTLDGPPRFPVGRIPLVPPISGLAADALALTEAGPFGGVTTVHSLAADDLAKLMYQSPRGLFAISAADLDGDGRIEGIGAARASGVGAQRDFEILYRTSNGEGFLPYRLATESAPRHIALGDYDGNGLTDIAYTEGVGAREHVMVSYGTRDRPLAPVEMASFSNIVAFLRVDAPSSIEPTGFALDDLVIVEVSPGMSGPPPFVVLQGNPQRSMLAYFDPRPAFRTYASEFVLAVAANFDPSTPAPDLVALERRLDPNAGESVYMMIASGTESGQGLSTQVTWVPTPIHGKACNGNMLCASTTEAIPWTLADGSRDVLIAVDNSYMKPRNLVTLDPMRVTANELAVQSATFTLPMDSLVFGMSPVDLEGDGVPQLAIAVGDFMDPRQDQVFLCDVSPSGVVTDCQDVVDKVPDLARDNWLCDSGWMGAVSAAGRHDLPAAAPRPPDQFLVLCKQLDPDRDKTRGTVFRISHDGTDYRAEPVYREAGKWEFMSLGDINGDQLTDLIGITLDYQTGIPTLHVHKQCAANDMQCIFSLRAPEPDPMLEMPSP